MTVIRKIGTHGLSQELHNIERLSGAAGNGIAWHTTPRQEKIHEER
jgi:hypothetical protein